MLPVSPKYLRSLEVHIMNSNGNFVMEFFCFAVSVVVVLATMVLDGWIRTKVSSRRNGRTRLSAHFCVGFMLRGLENAQVTC